MRTGPEYASLTADDLVTGEAVALDLPPASLGLRIASGLVDVVVTVAVVIAATFAFGIAALQSDAALGHVAYIATLIVAFLLLPTTLETLTRGRSLGKIAFGLRTVRDDAGPISFHHAFVRALVGIVEIYGMSGAPAFFSTLLSSRGKRLGDYAAGTYVVRERFRLRLPAPVAMPPELAPWAAAADIARLPPGLALAVRQLLGRSATLDPATRQRVALGLAAQVQRHVSPPPPVGTPPEAYLAAVMASRRERDQARLAREEALRRRLTSARRPGQ